MTMQWLCNADKSSHNPRLRLKYVPLLVYCIALYFSSKFLCFGLALTMWELAQFCASLHLTIYSEIQ